MGLMPHAGIYAEKSGQDHRKDEKIDFTGGTLVAGNLGLDLFLNNRWSLGLKYQIPLYQNLGGGHLEAKRRLMAQVMVLW
jgi:hypothetical protein